MSPADGADHADEYSLAVLFRRERQVGQMKQTTKNGRSRVSRGNKIQKLRKVFAKS